jgi:transcription elongation factor GreA
MLDPVPISRTGYNKIKEELDKLQEELTEVRQTVAEARELGDLKENGAYIYGRERQGFIVGKIQELQGILSRTDIVDCTTVECDCANFGTVVTLLDLDTQRKITYQLVGADEADCHDNGLSIHSPVGEALLGRVVGDRFTVATPRGDRNLEVMAIEKSAID